MSIDPEKRKELNINKSTLWYQQKKIKEERTIYAYYEVNGVSMKRTIYRASITLKEIGDIKLENNSRVSLITYRRG